MIMTGVIAPGQRLVEGRLAEQLGVSRNPVREAIRTLEHTTLVEVLPRRGACATLLDPSQIRPMQELRMGLEGWIANGTALRHTGADLKQLSRCIEEGDAAARAGDDEASGFGGRPSVSSSTRPAATHSRTIRSNGSASPSIEPSRS